MESMFENCQNIESLDLSSFQTSSATNMKKMFYNCDKLEYLDISNFVTTSVSDMTQDLSQKVNQVLQLTVKNLTSASSVNSVWVKPDSHNFQKSILNTQKNFLLSPKDALRSVGKESKSSVYNLTI